MHIRKIARTAAMTALVLSLSAANSGPWAAERDVILELNKLEPIEKACRAYFVIKNQSGDQFEDIKLDIFIFGKEDVISRRFAISTGELRPGKTVVRLFDIPDLDCGTVGRFLLNEVISCSTAAGPVERCGDRLTVAARGGTVFEY